MFNSYYGTCDKSSALSIELKRIKKIENQNTTKEGHLKDGAALTGRAGGAFFGAAAPAPGELEARLVDWRFPDEADNGEEKFGELGEDAAEKSEKSSASALVESILVDFFADFRSFSFPSYEDRSLGLGAVMGGGGSEWLANGMSALRVSSGNGGGRGEVGGEGIMAGSEEEEAELFGAKPVMGARGDLVDTGLLAGLYFGVGFLRATIGAASGFWVVIGGGGSKLSVKPIFGALLPFDPVSALNSRMAPSPCTEAKNKSKYSMNITNRPVAIGDSSI